MALIRRETGTACAPSSSHGGTTVVCACGAKVRSVDGVCSLVCAEDADPVVEDRTPAGVALSEQGRTELEARLGVLCSELWQAPAEVHQALVRACTPQFDRVVDGAALTRFFESWAADLLPLPTQST